MNYHLNLFRFYNESSEKDFIENNLTRAFALCLSNDSLFFSQYLQKIVIPEDFEYLFSVYTEDTIYNVDLQVDMSLLDLENIRKVYAVAMTTDQELDMSDFLKLKCDKERNITDIWITIKDIAFVIEVKRTLEDCKPF